MGCLTDSCWLSSYYLFFHVLTKPSRMMYLRNPLRSLLSQFTEALKKRDYHSAADLSKQIAKAAPDNDSAAEVGRISEALRAYASAQDTYESNPTTYNWRMWQYAGEAFTKATDRFALWVDQYVQMAKHHSDERSIQEWQAEAIKTYPELAVVESPLNLKFVSLYNKMKSDQPEFLNNPKWPLLLANEANAILSAAISKEDAQKIASFKLTSSATIKRIREAITTIPSSANLSDIHITDDVSRDAESLQKSLAELEHSLSDAKRVSECVAERETSHFIFLLVKALRSIKQGDANAPYEEIQSFLNNLQKTLPTNDAPPMDLVSSIYAIFSLKREVAHGYQQKADSFSSAGKTSEAIKQLEEANRIFPNPAILEQIKKLRDESLGL